MCIRDSTDTVVFGNDRLLVKCCSDVTVTLATRNCDIAATFYEQSVVSEDNCVSICLVFSLDVIRPVESHSGARGNILAGPPNISTRPLLGENF